MTKEGALTTATPVSGGGSSRDTPPLRSWSISKILFGSTRTSGTARVLLSIAVVLLVYTFGVWQPRDTAPPGLLDATTEQLVTGLEAGSFTSVDLVKAYLRRIDEVNPTLRAVLEINPDAEAIASFLDQERATGSTRGPLHGLPYLIKDNIATRDAMNNTAGSYALIGAKVPRDAGVVVRLRRAGVIILGKTSLSEWANYRSDNSSSGWNPRGGQATAPYYPNQNPCGSSSGSGIAAALGLAVATVGTETDGSIICPSDRNNLVGIKPTAGLTSRSMVVPISDQQDSVGPMARTVRDAAYLLQAMVGKDDADNYTSAIPFDPLPDYVAHCQFDSLRRARIGIPRNMIRPGEQPRFALEAFETAVATIRAAGANVIDNTNVTSLAVEDMSNPSRYKKSLQADFYSNLPDLYLSHLEINPQNIFSLEDLRDFTHMSEPEAYPDRNTRAWDLAIEQGFGNNDTRYWPIHAWKLRVGGPEGILGVLKNHSLDALILPSNFASTLSARVGAPVVTVPLGHYPKDQGICKAHRDLVETGPNIPFGLSFLGPKWSEARLISYAYAFEQRTHARYDVTPYIVPRTELVDILG